MTKPFNLADAKAGHPIATVCGLRVTVYQWDRKSIQNGQPIVGVIHEREEDRLIAWTAHGEAHCPINDYNLTMAPVGTLDGVDVYPGDRILNRHGLLTPVPFGVPFNPEDWTVQKVYPTTRMSNAEIDGAIDHIDGIGHHRLRRLINEGIKHGIDNGYLFDSKRHVNNADKRDEMLRGLLSLLGCSMNEPYTALHEAVSRLVSDRDNLDKTCAMFNRVLNEICTGMEPQTWEDIPSYLRRRDVAIAQHFYKLGVEYMTTMDVPPLPLDVLCAELTRVKV